MFLSLVDTFHPSSTLKGLASPGRGLPCQPPLEHRPQGFDLVFRCCHWIARIRHDVSPLPRLQRAQPVVFAYQASGIDCVKLHSGVGLGLPVLGTIAKDLPERHQMKQLDFDLLLVRD